MNNSGKTSTIILIVIAVLLLSLSAISLYYYNVESTNRKAAEAQLAQAKASEVKLDAELKEAKKQISILDGKVKEYDEKINGLLDELELQEGLREQMKVENASLKEALANTSQEQEELSAKLIDAQGKVSALETTIKSAEKLRLELEAKVSEMKDQISQPPSGVELGTIVVTPGEIPEGKIVSINEENNFAIFNLGREHGIAPDMLMSVYRGQKYLGDVKVARVEQGMSVADFVPPLTKNQIKKDDSIIAKK